MTPSYYQTPTAHRDRWMISYMDVLTILLIFFVAIAAQSLSRLKEKPAAAPPRITANQPSVTPAGAVATKVMDPSGSTVASEGVRTMDSVAPAVPKPTPPVQPASNNEAISPARATPLSMKSPPTRVSRP